MNHDEMLELGRRVIAALNMRDWAALARHMDTDRVEDMRSSPFLAAFPDVQIQIEAQFADSDHVITRWTNIGTHTGEFLGIAPTHRPVRYTGITIDQVVDGKVVDTWVESDMLGLFQQLGRREDVG